jgi:ABC-type transporter Mla subunit MlaD
MDIEILHERLSAAEGALLKLDGRIDELAQLPGAVADRLALLEETLNECKTTLLTLTTQQTETEEAIAAAALVEAEANAAAAVAEAEIQQTIAEQIAEPLPPLETEETEEVTDEEVTEMEPEPEPASAANEQPSMNWLEKLLVIR